MLNFWKFLSAYDICQSGYGFRSNFDFADSGFGCFERTQDSVGYNVSSAVVMDGLKYASEG